MSKIEARFFAKVEKIPFHSCWEWTSAKAGLDGYAVIWVNGRSTSASRLSWEIANKRSFPEYLDACHTCDNPGCVNPHHIWPGTPSQNAFDSVKKNRWQERSHPLKQSTHCKGGHEFTQKNTRQQGKNGRKCRACETLRGRKYRALKGLR